MRDIILNYFYSGSSQQRQLLRLIGMDKCTKRRCRKDFLLLLPIAFLLEPYKDLVARMIGELTDPDGIHLRFMRHMGDHGKMIIKQEEAGQITEIASRYLYAKFVFYILEPDLIEKMGDLFEAVYKILPDGLDFLEKFLTLAIPMIHESHLPDPAGAINALACIARTAHQDIIPASPPAFRPPPGLEL